MGCFLGFHWLKSPIKMTSLALGDSSEFFFEVADHNSCNNDNNSPDHHIPPPLFEFRHKLKVHTINPGNKCNGNEMHSDFFDNIDIMQTVNIDPGCC